MLGSRRGAIALRDIRGQALDVRPIEVLLERMIAEFRPVEVRLFGSRARGHASIASDWDLFVVVPDDLEAAERAGLRIDTCRWSTPSSRSPKRTCRTGRCSGRWRY